MSAIGNRINPDPAVGIELNATQFATIMLAYFIGDATAVQARDFTNTLLAESGYAPLTAQEEADVQAMKTHYDSLSVADQAIHRDKVVFFTQLVQDRNAAAPTTILWWDSKMGL